MASQSIAAINPATPIDEFDAWLKERHKWLQTAAAWLLKKNEPLSKEEIIQLSELCYGEATKDAATKFEVAPSGAFSSNLNQQALHIESIHKVNGLNAIKPDATLSFSKTGLTVIYGINGSGKSSFARLLKHVCGARVKDDLIPDVYMEAVIEPSAELKLSSSAANLAWTAKSGPVEQLKHVHVFDTKTAAVYYDQKNEATYEPKKMRFLTALIVASDQVGALLAQRKEALVRKLAILPDEFKETVTAKFLNSLSGKTKSEDIDAICIFGDEDKDERITLEAALKQSDSAEKLARLALEVKQIEELKTEVEGFKVQYSQENATLILTAHKDAKDKRKAASEDAKAVFGNAPLKGIGEASWMLLWEQARKYSIEHAYIGKSFPVIENAKCVLCQNDLDEDAQKRLASFENFVTGALEKSAKKAEDVLLDLLRLLPAVPDKEQWALKMQAVIVTGYDVLPDEIGVAKGFLEKGGELDKYKIPALTALEEAIALSLDKLQKEKKALTDLQDDKKRVEMVARLTTLKSREWLSGRKADVVLERERLDKLDSIEEAEKLCKTNKLSAKKGEIGEAELSTGYQNRFSEELKALAGTRIPINTVPQSGGKGKVTFRLTLDGVKHDYPVLKVLSEGEIRTVALAAFIADMKGSEMSMPFVFDDPISSLDQEFEEKVASRLVEMSKERQVIIFTHRLSLLTLLEDAIKKLNDGAIKNGGTQIENVVVTLTKFGNKTGVISEIDIRHKSPKKGFRELKDHQLPKLRKFLADGNVESFNEKMVAVCSGYRILIERAVEMNLLCEVVTRFRRSVHTQRITELSKIKPADCALIDELMSKYSIFEHSQSPEILAALPKVEELEADLDRILKWIEAY